MFHTLSLCCFSCMLLSFCFVYCFNLLDLFFMILNYKLIQAKTMKNLFILFASITFMLSGCKSQDSAVKQVRLTESQFLSDKAVDALKQHDFVLEAERLKLKDGRNTTVFPAKNFISMNGDKVVIQLTLDPSSRRYEGLALEGNASNIKMKTDKKGNHMLTMNVSGNFMTAVVSIYLIEGSNVCSVEVTSSRNTSRAVSLSGVLKPTLESDVIKRKSY